MFVVVVSFEIMVYKNYKLYTFYFIINILKENFQLNLYKSRYVFIN
jgi:hypothetical protein